MGENNCFRFYVLKYIIGWSRPCALDSDGQVSKFKAWKSYLQSLWLNVLKTAGWRPPPYWISPLLSCAICLMCRKACVARIQEQNVKKINLPNQWKKITCSSSYSDSHFLSKNLWWFIKWSENFRNTPCLGQPRTQISKWIKRQSCRRNEFNQLLSSHLNQHDQQCELWSHHPHKAVLDSHWEALQLLQN